MRLPVTRTVSLPRRDPSITSTTVTARMTTAGARGVQLVSNRQAMPNRIFITVSPVAVILNGNGHENKGFRLVPALHTSCIVWLG